METTALIHLLSVSQSLSRVKHAQVVKAVPGVDAKGADLSGVGDLVNFAHLLARHGRGVVAAPVVAAALGAAGLFDGLFGVPAEGAAAARVCAMLVAGFARHLDWLVSCCWCCFAECKC